MNLYHLQLREQGAWHSSEGLASVVLSIVQSPSFKLKVSQISDMELY